MNYAHLKGKRYVNLVRCSTMQQADTSVEDQQNLLNQFAAEHDLIHAGEDEVLEGVSGSKPQDRKDIDKLIARKLERDDFDALLVQDISRFTRGGTDHFGKLKYDLEDAGITVVFATMQSTGDSDQDSLVNTIGAYSAKMQAKAMSHAVVRGQMSSLAAQNIPHTFRIPFGIDRLYVGPDGKPRHRIRNLTDGSQQMLAVDTH